MVFKHSCRLAPRPAGVELPSIIVKCVNAALGLCRKTANLTLDEPELMTRKVCVLLFGADVRAGAVMVSLKEAGSSHSG